MEKKRVRELIDAEIRRHLSQAQPEKDPAIRTAHLDVVLALTYALEAIADDTP